MILNGSATFHLFIFGYQGLCCFAWALSSCREQGLLLLQNMGSRAHRLQ